MTTDNVKRKLRKKLVITPPAPSDMISTGSTLLNLACTSLPSGGFLKGHYVFLVGDSASGKTFLSLTCLAEAARSKRFHDYRFIYDNAEDGALMDVHKFFGSRVAHRIEPPDNDSSGGPLFSSTIEEFYFYVHDAILEGQPFIYILDSMDALSSEAEHEKFNKQKTAHRSGTATAGSYGDNKAKVNSANLRRLLQPLKQSGSILIIINQTRDNLGFGFEKKSRSGGHALRFYATIEIWSSVKNKLKQQVRGKQRQIGVNCKVAVKKNRITGQEREIEVPIYHSYGIDDIGSCVDYLLSEGHWEKTGQKIKATDFDFEGSREKLIRHIEGEGLYPPLRKIVGDVWADIEAACELRREPRYS